MLYTPKTEQLHTIFPGLEPDRTPWEVTATAEEIIAHLIENRLLPNAHEYYYPSRETKATHCSANVDPNSTIKGPAIIGPNTTVGHGTKLHGGVYLSNGAHVGFNSMVESSFIGPNSQIRGLSRIGHTIMEANVTLEAGAQVVDEEMDGLNVCVAYEGQVVDTGQTQFGAVIGSNVRIGANAVLRAGTLLASGVTVPQLQYVNQLQR